MVMHVSGVKWGLSLDCYDIIPHSYPNFVIFYDLNLKVAGF